MARPKVQTAGAVEYMMLILDSAVLLFVKSEGRDALYGAPDGHLESSGPL